MALLAESGNRLARGVDTESRPQDRKIKPGGTVFGKAVAAPADRTDQADRVERPAHRCRHLAQRGLLPGQSRRRGAAAEKMAVW